MFLSGLLTRFRNFITYNIYLKLLYHKYINKSSVIYTKLMWDYRFYLHDLCALGTRQWAYICAALRGSVYLITTNTYRLIINSYSFYFY